jgi:hypothetical protein
LVSWLIIIVSVTAVGATEFTTDETEETASEFSGGRFSNFFKRPRYQDTAVAACLKAINNTRNTAFNISGRAGELPWFECFPHPLSFTKLQKILSKL